MRIEIQNDVPSAEAAVVDAGLDEYNAGSAPLHDVRGLSCFARNQTGEVIGGAVGRTWGECCELLQLWVSPAHRRQGLGAGLVQAFEHVAEARGCRTFYLTTFSFQAPQFYQSLGYSVAATIEGFAPGVSKFLMVRSGESKGLMV